MKNDELTVRTPLGELVVGIKADPDYPGISVAFCGNGMNDCFNEGSIRLAWIEYSPEKCRLQAIFMVTGMQMTTHSSSSSRTFQIRTNKIRR